jgi:uncharacterized membrane-anchored protein
MTRGTSYRFDAAIAYAALVTRRISELREERLTGLQTYGEFMERQLRCRREGGGIGWRRSLRFVATSQPGV